MQALFSFLVLGDASGMSGVSCKEEASLSLPRQSMHSTNTLEHALIFLKGTVNEDLFMNLVSFSENFSPH